MSIQPDSNQLTLFAADFPVSHSQPQADAAAQPTTDGSGLNTSESFAELSPDGYWLKTYRGSYQYLMDGSLQEYSVTWPKAGTMRNGICYRQQPLAPRTSGTDSSLWPTPNTYEDRAEQYTLQTSLRHYLEGRQIHLSQAVKLWPTPRTSDGNGAGKHGTGGIDLRTAVRLYPTPTVQDAQNNGGPSQSLRNTPPLNAVVGGKLNPTWVAWLMGFPLEWLNLQDSAMP